jgi:hypothetical protein
MPNIITPIDDIQDSVERPVVFDIIRQVMELTHISHKTSIQFLGDEQRAAQKNSTITKDPISENRWSYDEKVVIEVDEDFDRNRLINKYVKQPEQYFIFEDDKLPIYIKPIYASSEVKITVKYKARDKNQAIKWRNDIQSHIAMMRDINLHEINYHYHLPEIHIEILKELHRLRENVAGYGDTFDDYFAKRLTNNASIITNLSGTEGIWAVSEKQIRVQGYFDFEGVPEKGDKEGDHDNWAISFVYSFKYEKPIECNMVYPLVIHNQLIGSKYRPSAKDYKLEDQPGAFTSSGRAFYNFESDNTSLSIMGNDGVSIPSFDEFIPNSIIPTTIRVFTALTSITEANKRFLFNLNELGQLQLYPKIIEFIKLSEYPHLGKAFHSIFALNLYRDSALVSDNALIVDSNLNVNSTIDLDLRKTYHVRLGLVTDVSYLRGEAVGRLRKYPDVGDKLIRAINSALTSLGGHVDINKNQLSNMDTVTLTGRPNYNDKDSLVCSNSSYGRGTHMDLVQSLFVVAENINHIQGN